MSASFLRIGRRDNINRQCSSMDVRKISLMRYKSKDNPSNSSVIDSSAFRKLSSIYVFSYFPFGFEGRIWDLIVSVPDHCLSFYFLYPWPDAN